MLSFKRSMDGFVLNLFKVQFKFIFIFIGIIALYLYNFCWATLLAGSSPNSIYFENNSAAAALSTNLRSLSWFWLNFLICHRNYLHKLTFDQLPESLPLNLRGNFNSNFDYYTNNNHPSPLNFAQRCYYYNVYIFPIYLTFQLFFIIISGKTIFSSYFLYPSLHL